MKYINNKEKKYKNLSCPKSNSSSTGREKDKVIKVPDKLYYKEKMKTEHKIICGDVLEEIKKIPSNSVHLAITSPPYNVGKNYDNHNDNMNSQEYLDWLNEVWKETQRVLVSGGDLR